MKEGYTICLSTYLDLRMIILNFLHDEIATLN